jgi:hypothetical protein
MRSTGALVLLVVSRVAAAKPPELAFIQLAPTRDGGAWLLVRAFDDIAVRRVSPDATLGEITVPTDRAIRAIATSPFDDSLWVLTSGPLLERTTDGAWRRVMLPPEPDWRGWQPTSAAVTPIGPQRAVVVRSCGDACSDVAVIDADASSADPRRLGMALGPSVADGRGGLWAVVHGHGVDLGYEVGGYAHFDGGQWDAWTTASDAFGLIAIHRADFAPTQLAADGRGGAIAANDDELATIGPDGAIANRGSLASSREHWANQTRGVIAAGDEAIVVAEESRHDGVDPSPVVRHVALASIRELGAERVPVQASWRAEHLYDNILGAAAAGGTLWIVSGDALFYRNRDGWKTIAGRGPEHTRKILASMPIDVGLATRPAASNGISVGLRPEVIIPFDHFKYPIYGIGPYVEAVAADGPHVEGLFGGGLTAIVYGDMWAVSISGGADARYSNGSTHPQLALSAFLGLREYNGPWFDLPLGLRVDARPGTSDVPGSVTFSLAVDAGWFVALGYAVTAPLRSD